MRDGGYEEVGNFLEFSKNVSEQRRTAAGTCSTEDGRARLHVPGLMKSVTISYPPEALANCFLHHYQASLTAGTIMEKTRTPPEYMVLPHVLHGKSEDRCFHTGGIQVAWDILSRAWLMSHKIRQAMMERDAGYKLAQVHRDG